MFCPACGNTSFRCTNVQFGYRNELPWYQCLECRSFFVSEHFDRDNEIARLQNTDYGSEDLGISLCEFKTTMYDAVLELLKKHTPPPALLLDVGCSYGGFLLRAQQDGYNVCGSDINPQAVEYVQNLGIRATPEYSIGNISLVENASVDVLTCLDCNCYWPNQPSELRCAFQKLKPGGYLAMRVVDKSWMCALGLKIRKMAPHFGKRLLDQSVNDHRFSMSVKSLLKVIESCGLQVITASPRGALHSHRTRWIAKASFAFGSLVWATTGMFVAPGALVLARKPFE